MILKIEVFNLESGRVLMKLVISDQTVKNMHPNLTLIKIPS